MIKALVIDDEQDCREVLVKLLARHCPQVKVVGTAVSALSGLAACKKLNPDLVFLDIEMPDASGFDLLSQIDNLNFNVIFTTAYDQYAIQAFRFSAMDYLLKPIDYTELITAVKKVESNPVNSSRGKPVRESTASMKMLNHGMNKIALPTSNGLKFASVENIIRCESSNVYTFIYFTDGDRLLVSRSLKEFEQLLSGQEFYRIHQSHLVNMEHVSEYVKLDGGYVVMSDKTQIAIAKRRKDDFLRKLEDMRL